MVKQLTLEESRRAERGPRVAGPNERRIAQRRAHAVATGADEPDAAAKFEARKQVVRALRAFLTHVYGREFQACDFHNWMHESGLAPEGFEGRATGGLFVKLAKRGFIRSVGFRTNAGGRLTNYNATPRSVYVCERVPSVEDML